jgi:hypothetical protein
MAAGITIGIESGGKQSGELPETDELAPGLAYRKDAISFPNSSLSLTHHESWTADLR